MKRILMEHVEAEAPKFIFKDGLVKQDEKSLQHCAYWFGLSVIKEKLMDGRFRTVQYDVQAIPEDATVYLKSICFGKVQVPGNGVQGNCWVGYTRTTLALDKSILNHNSPALVEPKLLPRGLISASFSNGQYKKKKSYNNNRML